MYLHMGGTVSETDLPWCYSHCMLLKLNWHKTGLTNKKIRSSNSFNRSWAALLCYPPIRSMKYVWIRQFLLSHRVENILLTPASIKIHNFSWTKEEFGVRTQVGLWEKDYKAMFVGERRNVAIFIVVEVDSEVKFK